ncbi:MAG: DUF6463 family protein [Dysgonamonadaceae bacterium]|jgi:hypothetical protein|nr:DUF6463 family protein [Dysgonamonadaceae bacterium]
MKKVKIWKYSGIFLIATGILHTIVAIALGKDAFLEIIQDGVVNVTSQDYARAFALWFLICGIFVILLGQVLHYYIKKEQKPAPLFFGYSLLILTIFGCIVEPISGFWLLLPQALIIIFANKKGV